MVIEDFHRQQPTPLILQLFACSVDSPQVHQAWVNAPATELDEADGLGRMPPFPLLGDKGGGPGGHGHSSYRVEQS